MSTQASLPSGAAAFLEQSGLMTVFDLIEAAGGEIRVNGGAVRNALMGEPVADVDLSTTLLPDHVTEALQRGGVKVVPTGVAHGTVTAVSDGRAYEITTLREDIETDGRRAIVRFGHDWTADAQRRDFTMNAIYCDRHGAIFDPLGGYDDLVARRVRFIGDPVQRIMEDRLRILRFFRFFAWYGLGRPDADALKACAALKDGLNELSAERVWQELKRILSAPDIVKAVLWMRTTGVFDQALPESAKWGVDLIPRLNTCERQLGWSPDSLLRLMAVIPPRPDVAATIAARLKLSNAEAERLGAWARASLPRSRAAEPELARELYRGDCGAFLDRLRLERARLQDDDSARNEARRLERTIDYVEQWERPQLPLKGKDLVAAGMRPGPEMGRAMQALEQAWIDSGFMLTRDQLLARAPTAGQ